MSGSITTLGGAAYPTAGLLFPENMTVGFAGLTATIGLPSPWGLVTSGGVIVHAHGTQTGQDTTSYTVSFAPVVPATGSQTAYLVASVVQIQQNPFPLTGPPQGHPSFNPNFIPSTAYATNAYSVSLAAVTGVPNNTTTFELLRTTLTAGQNSITAVSDIGWQRAPNYNALPANPFAAGGIMTLAQAQAVATPLVANLSQTLPAVATAGGLSYKMVNPLSVGNWTIVAQSADRITGATGTPAASLVIPPGGAMQVWGNAASGQWDITEVNPLMLASIANVFTAPQTIAAPGTANALTLAGGTTVGTNMGIIGNGATTPNKYLRVLNGTFGIVNSAYTSQILGLDDSGNLTITGSLTGTALTLSGAAYVNGLLTVNASANIYGTLTSYGATTVTGALNANTIGATTSINAGTSVTASSGNVTAFNGRLRATYGAYGSADPNAGVLLADFVQALTGNGYVRLPDGVLLQWGSYTVTIDNAAHLFNFPTSFASACFAVVPICGAFAPYPGAMMGAQAANASQFYVTVASSGGIGQALGSWFIAVGV